MFDAILLFIYKTVQIDTDTQRQGDSETATEGH